MQKYGIDVSYAQGANDWAKIKAAGVDFAMIRSGRRSQSGDLGEDTHFARNVQGAVAAGMDIGLYFYSSAKSVQEAEEEADFVLAQLAKYPETFTYPIAYDMEVDYTNFDNQSKALNTSIAKAFLSKIEAAGYYAMLYTFKSFAESNLNMSELSDYDFWLAHVGNGGAAKTSTSYTGPYGIWQYSWKGSINGISGDVDENYAYQDYAAIIKAVGLNGFSGEDKEEIKNDLDESASNCEVCADKEFFFESIATIERMTAAMKDRLES